MFDRFPAHVLPSDKRVMTRNTGQPSQDHFETFIQCQGKSFWYHRFEDQKDLYRLNAGKRVKSGGKPADFLVCWNGAMTLCEVKSTVDPVGFRIADIRKGQLAAAVGTTAAKGHYQLFIHAITGNRWYRVPWPFIRQLMDDGRKTIRWNEIEEFRFTQLEKFS